MYAPTQALPQTLCPDQAMVIQRTQERRAGRRTALATLCALMAILAMVLFFDDVATLPELPDLPALPTLTLRLPFMEAPHCDPAEKDAWYLVLVNDEHPIEPCQPNLVELRNSQAVDARCYPDLQRMFDAARAEGIYPRINSSYRSRDEQQRILDDTIAEGVRTGLTEDEARSQVLRTVAEPGTSEHETGLAIDVSSDQQTSKADKAVHRWLAAHGWEYGGILRYPEGKEELTGIDNEPWHFRYVGVEAAREMHASGLCLEEYVD